MTSPAQPRQRIGIIASNPHTASSLRSYLEEAGLEVLIVTGPRRLAEMADLHALIVFPDDYPLSALLPMIDFLRRARSRPRLVVITRAPDRLAALSQRFGKIVPVVMARPAFGWAILDVLRGRAQGTP
jgi:hypothetical protein